MLGADAQRRDGEPRGPRAADIAPLRGKRISIPVRVFARDAGVRVRIIPEELEGAPRDLVHQGIVFGRQRESSGILRGESDPTRTDTSAQTIIKAATGLIAAIPVS